MVELVARRDELAAMRVPDRIRTSVRLRLEMLAPVMGAQPMQSHVLCSHTKPLTAGVGSRVQTASMCLKLCTDLFLNHITQKQPVVKRLHVLADTWPQALAIQARPASMPAAARALAALADDIWHAAGDTSTDYNWCAQWQAAAALAPAACLLCHLADSHTLSHVGCTDGACQLAAHINIVKRAADA